MFTNKRYMKKGGGTMEPKNMKSKNKNYKNTDWLSVRHFTFVCDAAKESSNSNGFYDKLSEIDLALQSFGVLEYGVKFK